MFHSVSHRMCATPAVRCAPRGTQTTIRSPRQGPSDVRHVACREPLDGRHVALTQPSDLHEDDCRMCATWHSCSHQIFVTRAVGFLPRRTQTTIRAAWGRRMCDTWHTDNHHICVKKAVGCAPRGTQTTIRFT
jgi:hypothetical protein